MFNRKSRIITCYSEEIKRLSIYKHMIEEQRIANHRCEVYPKLILEGNNHIVIDLLDNYNATAIYIYKLDCPAEEWMFKLGFSLQYKEFATLIGKLEFGMTIEKSAKIEKLGVIKEYRNKGLATYMMKRAIDWSKSQNFNELILTASASKNKHGNELNYDELINFYNKLGFKCKSPNSNHLVYKF